MEVDRAAPIPALPPRMPEPDKMAARAAEPAAASKKSPTVDAAPAVEPLKRPEPPAYLKAPFEPNPNPDQVQRELQESVRAANERLLERGQQVKIDIDKTPNMVVVSVKDNAGSTVRQIPPEQSLQIARSVDRLTGILVDKKA
jgi:flagellar protein FlaG